ncbi:hypothetical protein NKR23_g5093 [Pleurostoma richardsiae]|uniref:Uncharacterized protein n=1 Tax=Pleurostoma richardsiae TaxID=41990 RepID=A0AA38REG1_9PEZI|nr:hypothetical protein NKR23_g5093 [Pleurostoma richardsiae]
MTLLLECLPVSVRGAFFSSILSFLKTTLGTPQTLTEKIVRRYCRARPGKKVKVGDYATLAPYRCMTYGNSWPVALKFMSISVYKLYDDQQIAMSLKDDIQNNLCATDVGRGGVIPTVAPKVKFYIAAASPLEQQSAEETSDWQVLDAGAQPLPSGCIPCIGLEEPGEAGISAREGDFKGRMGTDKPEDIVKVINGEGNGDAEQDETIHIEETLRIIIAQAESMISGAEKKRYLARRRLLQRPKKTSPRFCLASPKGSKARSSSTTQITSTLTASTRASSRTRTTSR